MSISLTRILQQITGLNSFFSGPNASQQNGVVLQDSASVTWTTDGFGNVIATTAGGASLPAATAVGQTLIAPGAGTTYNAGFPLPTATAAGQVPTATGAGNAYTAQTPAMVLISEQTLGSAATNVTFSSIPQTYKDLRIVVRGLASAAGTIYIQLNGDVTTSDYFFNSITSSFANNTLVQTGGFTSPGAPVGVSNTNLSSADASVYGYSLTNTFKSIMGQGLGNAWAISGSIWASNSAVTSVKVLVDGTITFSAGTVVSLFGIN